MSGPVTLNADDGTPLPRTAELITELTITFGVEYTRVLVLAVEQANRDRGVAHRRAPALASFIAQPRPAWQPEGVGPGLRQ